MKIKQIYIDVRVTNEDGTETNFDHFCASVEEMEEFAGFIERFVERETEKENRVIKVQIDEEEEVNFDPAH